MSQPDLARTLREARPVAPAELRERVRLVAAQASPPRRQLVTWRRALVLAVVVGAAVAAGVIATRPSHHAIAAQEAAIARNGRTDSLGLVPLRSDKLAHDVRSACPSTERQAPPELQRLARAARADGRRGLRATRARNRDRDVAGWLLSRS